MIVWLIWKCYLGSLYIHCTICQESNDLPTQLPFHRMKLLHCSPSPPELGNSRNQCRQTSNNLSVSGHVSLHHSARHGLCHQDNKYSHHTRRRQRWCQQQEERRGKQVTVCYCFHSIWWKSGLRVTQRLMRLKENGTEHWNMELLFNTSMRQRSACWECPGRITVTLPSIR